jgi:mannosyl-3-phosphoglycerate phosphatase
MPRIEKTIIYSDLDGAFLDDKTYSYQKSLPALHAAKQAGIHIVFCANKTRAEIEHLREIAEIEDPFIVENGAAIFVPNSYFPFTINGAKEQDGFKIIELGEPRLNLIALFRLIRTETPGSDALCFSDMTPEELAADSGLSLQEAHRAKARGYSEPFRFTGDSPEPARAFLWKIKEAGMRVSVGHRYHHLQGESDKGRAVKILDYLFRRDNALLKTIGIGSSLDDALMLRATDLKIIPRRSSGAYHPALVKQFPQAQLTEGVGPQGWADAVMQLVNKTCQKVHS